MPTRAGGEKSTSWVVQFRVNERDEAGRMVLEILFQNEAEGRKDGDLCIPAIIAFKGKEVPEFNRLDQVALRLAEIEDLITESHNTIMEGLQQALEGVDISQFTNASGRTLEEEVGERVSSDVRKRFMGGGGSKSFDVD